MSINKKWHSLPRIIYSRLSSNSVPQNSVFVSYHSKYFFFGVVKTQVIMYFPRPERGFSSLILKNVYVTLHAQQGKSNKQ